MNGNEKFLEELKSLRAEVQELQQIIENCQHRLDRIGQTITNIRLDYKWEHQK